MYHLGKVLKVIAPGTREINSADNSFQVQLEMWDSNQVIVLVHPVLQEKIKPTDFVLVKYAQPEATVWKILKQKEGKELWENLTSYLSKKKLAAQNQAQFVSRPESGIGKMIG